MSTTMASAISLSRAISKRISNRDSHNPLSSFTSHRSSKRHSDMAIKKNSISGPVQLLSTTNSQLFNAPAVSTVRVSTSIEIPPSPDMSSAGSPPPLTPDKVSPIDSGLPTPPTTPTMDKVFSNYPRLHSRNGSAASNMTDASYGSYKYTYHQQLPNRAKHSSTSSTSSNGSSSVPPPIPQRKSSSSSTSRKSSDSTTSSNQASSPTYSFFPPPPKSQRRLNRSLSNGALKSASHSQAMGANNMINYNMGSMKGSSHPFGKELAQVSELAEEMGLDLDEECMMQKGLQKFSAEDYLAEVEEAPVVKGLFGRKPSIKLGGGAGWI